MKTLINIKILLFIVYFSIITHNAYSFRLHDQKSLDQIAMKSDLIDDDASSSMDDYGSVEDSYPEQIQPDSSKRHADSAEKYFDWASKTNRPMEYLRGKRFWIFTKKDEYAHNHDTVPHGNPSVGQGIWRSGILGRR